MFTIFVILVLILAVEAVAKTTRRPTKRAEYPEPTHPFRKGA